MSGASSSRPGLANNGLPVASNDRNSSTEPSTQSESDDDAKRVAMPPDLLKTARDVVGRPVSMLELWRAWDACAAVRGAEKSEGRVIAVLEKLLDPATDNEPAVAERNTTQSPLKLPSVHRGQPRDKRNAIEISDSSDDDDSDNDGGHVEPPVVESRFRRGSKKRKLAGKLHPIEVDSDAESAGPKRKKADRKGKGRQTAASVTSKPYSGDSLSSSASSSNTSSLLGDKDKRAADGDTPPTPDEGASKELDPSDSSMRLAIILSMVPEVDPPHAQKLVEEFSNLHDCVERVIDKLFSEPFPKVKREAGGSNKRTAQLSEEESLKLQEEQFMNIKKRQAPTPVYCEAAFDLLVLDFPRIPKPHIRKVHMASNHFYAPAYQQLCSDMLSEPCPYKSLSVGRKEKGKGRGVEVQSPALEEERQWIIKKRDRDTLLAQAKVAQELAEQEEEAAGYTMECGCCFGETVMSKMVQCPEAHLFCMDCARKNAENVIGMGQTELCCMHESGCQEQFTKEECQRFLKLNQIECLDRLRANKAIDLAGIEGLAKCPFCDYACVIENPDEKLFRCANDDCKRITCRSCRKADHLPKSCEEHADDLKKNNIHKVEEAMTAALLKKCPKCQQVFIKEYGCNKMMCSHCHTLSCYLCGEKIRGYDHFKNQPLHTGGGVNTTSNCNLWDDSEKVDYERVEAARKAAAAEVLEHAEPDALVSQEELDKLKAKAPPARNAMDPYGVNAARAQAVHGAHAHVHAHAQARLDAMRVAAQGAGPGMAALAQYPAFPPPYAQAMGINFNRAFQPYVGMIPAHLAAPVPPNLPPAPVQPRAAPPVAVPAALPRERRVPRAPRKPAARH